MYRAPFIILYYDPQMYIVHLWVIVQNRVVIFYTLKHNTTIKNKIKRKINKHNKN